MVAPADQDSQNPDAQCDQGGQMDCAVVLGPHGANCGDAVVGTDGREVEAAREHAEGDDDVGYLAQDASQIPVEAQGHLGHHERQEDSEDKSSNGHVQVPHGVYCFLLLAPGDEDDESIPRHTEDEGQGAEHHEN